jgi:hypothetical protein
LGGEGTVVVFDCFFEGGLVAVAEVAWWSCVERLDLIDDTATDAYNSLVGTCLLRFRICLRSDQVLGFRSDCP